MTSEKNKFLTNEQKLLIETSRLGLSKENIIEILDSKINWYEFLKLSAYHKTITLCFHNIRQVAPKTYIPKYMREIVRFIYNEIYNQNILYIEEARKVITELEKNDIFVIPVKGTMLVPSLYKQYGIRYLGDVDCLVRYKDVKKLTELMKNIGYIIGRYNHIENKLETIDRFEEIKWKVSMSNLHPFVKQTNNANFPFYKFDFRFSLDDSLNKDPVNEIIDSYIETKSFRPAHALVHLCTHFYNEAKYTLGLYACKDLNLIKLCDIREYILQCMSPESLLETIDFTKKYNLQRHVYYTIYCLELIYDDGYERDLLNMLDITDTGFINTFGDNTKNENMTFKKSFWERLFSCDNSEELDCIPKYFS